MLAYPFLNRSGGGAACGGGSEATERWEKKKDEKIEGKLWSGCKVNKQI